MEKEASHDIEACISHLADLKHAVSCEKPVVPSEIEMDLNALFSRVREEKTVSEMERVVVLLCKIGQKIIQAPTITKEKEMVLLQIFELGLFMVQFKDRWLARLEETGMLQEQEWGLSLAHAPVEKVFSPSRDLVSLAQEYILRSDGLEDKRCDVCAFALANVLKLNYSTVALLLRQEPERKRALGCLFFLGYVFADARETQAELLAHWLEGKAERFDTSVLYLPTVDILKFFAAEMQKIDDFQVLKKVLLAGKSHLLIHMVGDAFLSPHRNGKVATDTILDVLVATYTEKEAASTEHILAQIWEYNLVAGEYLTKSLIIFRHVVGLAQMFFERSMLIDKDYVECTIICRDRLRFISGKKLKELCSSQYFPVLCKDSEVFRAMVSRIEEVHAADTVTTLRNGSTVVHKWDLEGLVHRTFSSLDITIETFEKALWMARVFPSIGKTITRALWKEIDKKSTVLRLLHKEERFRDDLETLGHFRSIPKVGEAIRLCLKRLTPSEEVSFVFQGTLDPFLVQWINDKLHRFRRRGNIREMQEYLEKIKTREELQSTAYWGVLAKKEIVFGKCLGELVAQSSPDEVLRYLYNEEDIGALLQLLAKTPAPAPLLLSSALEKLDQQSRHEKGAVLGSSSFISVKLHVKKLTVYFAATQKEFSDRQSLIKFISDKRSLELYILNGKTKLAYTETKGLDKQETIVSIDEEFEKHPLGGWKISLAITVTQKECLLTIGEAKISQKLSLSSITEVIIGENFKGILQKALILEDSHQFPAYQSIKPSETYFLDVLLNIEKTMQYHKKFALLIESPSPYHISGPSPEVRMANVFPSAPTHWRASERFTRILAKVSSKLPSFEKKALSLVLPQEDMGVFFHL